MIRIEFAYANRPHRREGAHPAPNHRDVQAAAIELGDRLREVRTGMVDLPI
jgi:hypothetical protein